MHSFALPIDISQCLIVYSRHKQSPFCDKMYYDNLFTAQIFLKGCRVYEK